MTTSTDPSLIARDRILVVADGGRLVETVRGRFPDWDVATATSYLSGISDLARHPARVVLAYVNSGVGRLDRAVAGLREAAGTNARLILCCPPEFEPRTRRLIGAGADDYVVFPVTPRELDSAIGVVVQAEWPRAELTPVPAASMEELSELGELLSHLDDGPSDLLGRLANLIRTAMGCSTVCVTADNLSVPSGLDPKELVLIEPIESNGQVLGHVGVGPRVGRPFTNTDTLKLRHYATLSSHLLTAASKHRRSRELAMTDEVTGLPNRRYLHRFLTALIERARRERFRVTMLVFDIDDFKTFNDTFGHDVGDEVLRVTADLFRRHTREHDVVARYGGDEFGVVFWDAEQPRVAGSQHPSDALAVLRRCTEALQAQEFPMLGPNARGVLTVSGGLATFPWHADNADDLIRRADDALLVAKRAGKDRIYLIGEADDSASGPRPAL